MKRLLLVAAILATAACASPSLAQQTAAPVAPAQPAAGLTETDMVWAKPSGLELRATVYRSASAHAGPLPVLIDVHGGAWGAYDRTSDALYCRELAKSGLLVVSVDFRQSPDFQHPAGSADVAAAVRWVRLNAQKLGADPEQIGLIGSSSGAHLALLAALRPDAPQHKGTPVSDAAGRFAPHDDIDGTVDYVVAMWPVSDPAARFRYAKRAGVKQLVDLTQRYFPTEDAMWDASIQRIVTSGESKALPPILVVQPGEDSNIPQDMTFDLMRAWQARGGKLEYVYYPGEAHAFGHRPSAATTDLVSLISDYIRRQLAVEVSRRN